MADKLKELTEVIENDAKRFEKNLSIVSDIEVQEETIYDEAGLDEIKIIPTPNFSDAKPMGTVLPINMVSETVNNLSRLANQFDLVDYVREKLGYATRASVIQKFGSEQIDGIVLATQQMEKGNAFILGDSAGIGKGRQAAAILRYAYQRKAIPVFITHKPYLFSDIYRDIKNIGGFADGKDGKMVEPMPFILNTGNKDESTIKDFDGRIIAAPLSNALTLKVCEGLELPKKGNRQFGFYYNCVFMTYSQLSNVRSDTKQRFLEAIAPDCIFVFDESHNAASTKSTAKVLVRSIPLIEKSKGVMFSSATYAKNPHVFPLYVVKTSLRTAVPSLENIADALKVGGENVAEYIASGLVKEGQMIRRERSFGDCEKVTLYVDTPEQRVFYDEAIGYFKELRDFSKSRLGIDGIKASIMRKCDELEKDVVPREEYEDCFKGTAEQRSIIRNGFITRNRNKYVLFYTADSISRYKMFFRENLFYALKAKYTADKIIECLNTPVSYTNMDGRTYMAPKKPIIAIRNTNESIFNMLDFNEGSRTSNDFSEYLRAIYNKLFSGTFRLRKIDTNIFEAKTDLIERGIDIEDIEQAYEYNVLLSDFTDGGAEIQGLQSRLNSYTSNLPMSAIDYIKDRINTAQRSAVYFNEQGQNKYGTVGPYYRFNEATGRKSMLKRDGDAFVYTRNDKLATITDAFRSYNNGATDVLLINVSASTGGSAQSSPDEGIDTRPRNMFIVQFELDINVEVQKRGRINRTGQLNSPTYTYVISQIPVELRTYLMFRKKLRKLDANISANQTQSSQSSEILDANGNPIEDLFNQYGFETFKDDFIYDPQFNTPGSDFKSIFDEMMEGQRAATFAGQGEEDEFNAETFNKFVRELELYPADFQEIFFNEMNARYIQHVEKLKQSGDYQLELVAKNYKAAVKQRVVTRLNSGSTVFSMPLFLEDDYTLEETKAWAKEKVMEKADKLANDIAPGATKTEMHRNLLLDFNEKYEAYRQESINALNASMPLRGDYDTQEAYDNAVVKLEGRIANSQMAFATNKAEIANMLQYFAPMRKVTYRGNLGVFVGYRIKQTGKFRYSKGNIEFIFCFLNRYPIIHLKISSDAEDLNDIITESNAVFSGQTSGSRLAFEAVTQWRPDYNKRIIRRFMSGNILSGIVEANKMKIDKRIKNFILTRYTMIDSSIATAIELKMDYDLRERDKINESQTPLSVACNNAQFLDYVNKIPFSSQYESFPIWDENTRVALLKRDENDTDMLYVNVIGYLYKDALVKESSTNYNPIFVDEELENKNRPNRIRPEGKVTVDYFPKVKKERTGGQTVIVETADSRRGVFVKSFLFDMKSPRDAERMRQFFSDLYERHETLFNFRSSIDDYFFIEDRPDIFNPATNSAQSVRFEVGEYEYKFSKLTPESIATTIPGFIRRTDSGYYGGVILEKPLSPTMLPSYNLKPYGLPPEVMINLLLAELNATDKAEFRQNLRDVAEMGNDFNTGQYIERFIRTKLVPVIYFFGDMRPADYGKIFSNYILDLDYNSLSFDEVVEVREVKPIKTVPTFEDAENFLIHLM